MKHILFPSRSLQAVLVSAIMILPLSLSAEVNWILQLGGWYSNQYTGNVITEYTDDGVPSYYPEKSGGEHITAGLFLQIPLSSKTPFYLETGLGYRYKRVLSQAEDREFDPDYILDKKGQNIGSWELGVDDYNGHFIEVPVKAGYRLKLNSKNAFEFGAGPYMAVLASGETKLSVGMTASVVYRHRCMSFGFAYSNPVFLNGPRDYHKNNMFTFNIGINFGNKAWNHIGKAAMIAGSVAGTVAETYSQMQAIQNNSESYGYDYSGSDSGSGSGGRIGNDGNEFSVSEQTAYNRDKATYERYDSQLSSHFAGNMTMSESSVREAQRKMAELRKKWEAKGKSFPRSSNETRR